MTVKNDEARRSPRRGPIDAESLARRLSQRVTDLPVPPAEIPAADIPGLQAQRALTDEDIWTLAARTSAANPGLNLEGANLANAQLAGIGLFRPDLYNAIAPGAVFDRATIAGCWPNNSQHEILSFCASLASIQDADISGINFSACTFNGVNFNGANVRSSNLFAFCDLRQSSWLRTTLRGSSIAGGVTFHWCNFAGAGFHSWNISLDDAARPVVFNHCDLTGAIFEDCSLNGVRFLNCSGNVPRG